MSLAPPQPAMPGQPYYLSFTFTSFETGSPVDPVALTLDLTYGEQVGAVPDVAGPFTYSGASSEASDTIWRTGTGAFTFRWDVPSSGLLPGVYVANWTATYGSSGDEFLALENFPLISGAPFTPVPSGDTGYWTGSLTWSPSWASSPLGVQFGATDEDGITWLWQKIDGWDSAPTVGSVVQRSADHGGWPAAQFYGPRLITLTVSAAAPTQALRDAARSKLQQAVPVGVTGTDLATLVYNEPVPKQALVRRNGGGVIAEAYPTLTDVIFTVPLVAPDMRKYSVQQQNAQIILPAPPLVPLVLPFASGLPVTFPGGLPPESVSVTVTNLGDFETRPQLTVTGPVTSPAVVNATTGQAISFSGLTLAATDSLVVDLSTRQALLNGIYRPADISSAWWVMPPGTTTVQVTGTASTGSTMTVAWRDAWI